MNDTCSHFQNMNEYCLLNIFSINSVMDLMDLCALAETCKRFKRFWIRFSSNGIAWITFSWLLSARQFYHNLAQLTKLSIMDCYDLYPFDVVDTVSRLVNLQELTIIHRRFVLDETQYSKILGIVKDRPHVLTFECESNFEVKENCYS